jgi:NTP pyrophosphatase (non-canonical NTP hydrolase)
MTIAEFQRQIEAIYYEKDSARGASGCLAWLVEEVGELARAVRRGERRAMEEEFADVLAWVATLASIEQVELERAVGKYAGGCPKCRRTPCACPEA